MRIELTVSHDERSMEIDDGALLAAYKAGGLEAVHDLCVAEADAISEQPFWWPDRLSEHDIHQIKGVTCE